MAMVREKLAPSKEKPKSNVTAVAVLKLESEVKEQPSSLEQEIKEVE